jgi:hypothetical protein
VSEDDPGRTFISRWSRRKIAARQADAAPEPLAPPVPPPAVAAEAVADEPRPADPGAGAPTQPDVLPDVETLKGLESEYRQFLRPGVDESLRRTALQKLFADPHFNVMDGLDVYIDDYSKPDPIPSALLRTLNQARGLKLFDDEEQPEAAPQPDHAAAPHPSMPAQTAQVTDSPAESSTAGTQSPDVTQSAEAAAPGAVEDGKSG